MAVYAQDPYGNKAINGRVLSCQIHVWKGGRIVMARDFDPKGYPPQVNNMAEWFRRTFIQLGLRSVIGQLRKWGKNWEHEAQMQVNHGEGPKQGRGRNYNVFSCEIPTDDGDFKIELHIRHEAHQQRYHRFRRENPDYKPRAQPGPPVVHGEETKKVGQRDANAPYLADGTIDFSQWVMDAKTGLYYDPKFGPPEL